MNATRRTDPSARHPRARSAMTLLLACAACGALLALAACGVTAGASPSSTKGASPAQPLTGHVAVRPCTGAYAVAGAKAPSLVLTLQTPNQAGTVRIGDVVQVRLPITHHWTLASVPSGLELLGPPAQQDAQLDVCFWNFKLDKAATYVLAFTGATPCDPKVSGCQPASATARFTITVS